MKVYTLFIIWLSVIVIFVLFCLFTRKWNNPYKLFMVFGKKGSGKSTYLVKCAVKYLKKGWIVYTNMEDMMVDGVRWFNLQHLGDYVPEKNSVLLLDEVGMVWDARDFKNFKPSVRDFFKLQRHYHVICYLASQTFDIDKKLRDLTDGMFLHTSFLNVLSVGKRIYKKIVLTESTSEAESRISENLKFALPFNWTFTWIPKYAKYFNSYEVPDMPNLSYRAVECGNKPSSRPSSAKRLLRRIEQNKISRSENGSNADVDETTDNP
ncbi:MAG: zonular occludens toxin domain-containing protein [Oscillospiraceae bacterium]